MISLTSHQQKIIKRELCIPTGDNIVDIFLLGSITYLFEKKCGICLYKRSDQEFEDELKSTEIYKLLCVRDFYLKEVIDINNFNNIVNEYLVNHPDQKLSIKIHKEAFENSLEREEKIFLVYCYMKYDFLTKMLKNN